MTKRRSFFVWGFLAVILLIGGCVDIETPESTHSPLSTASPAAKPDAAAGESPLPTPGLLDWNTTPAAGQAILRGRIEFTETTVHLGELFLAKAVKTSDPNIDLLELDEATAPRATLDRNTGEFMFLDIEPGKYGLIVWGPLNSYPLNDPATGETLFVMLSADQVTDVGTLYIP